MQSQTRDIQDLAHHAVMNVLAGRTADGSASLDIAVPFPRGNRDMTLAAGYLLAILLHELPPTTPEDVTPIAAKLLAHAAKGGYTSGTALMGYPIHALLEALRAKPSLIRGPAGFATIIKQWNRSRANALTALAEVPVTPRRLLWSEPPFALTEVTHPKHLREDGLTLHHCTARATDWDLLNGLGRPPTPREELFALTYWRRIDAGQTRILTLVENDAPVVTIEYDIATRRIPHLQARHPIRADAPFLRPLCRALHHFSQGNAVMRIKGLPDAPAPNAVLTKDGAFAPVTAGNLRHALIAEVAVHPRSTPRELLRLAAMPHLTLNLTRAPFGLRNVLTDAACSIRMDDEYPHLPELRTVGGDFDCAIALTVWTPELLHIGGSNLCRHADHVHQPRLLTVGNQNDCRRARHINQSSLGTVGGTNNCRTAILLYQRRLTSVGGLNFLPPDPKERAARAAFFAHMHRRLRGETPAPEAP